MGSFPPKQPDTIDTRVVEHYCRTTALHHLDQSGFVLETTVPVSPLHGDSSTTSKVLWYPSGRRVTLLHK